ncbi:MAG: TIGR02452 family protein, partial [Planctomycetes bacterium]|nr:TIGR02452 family protein [Planctomycetota bacterium]
MDHDSQRSSLIAQAETAKAIMAAGAYRSPAGLEIDLHQALESSRTGTSLVRPGDWASIQKQAVEQCQSPRPVSIEVTDESTLAALERLAFSRSGDLAALNFASARRPGGGWDTGARAQEETLARASGLITCLEAAPGYYAANRQHEHLFYTDHAIWSPAVPFFARDDGTLLAAPYTAGIITMPAPNLGGMSKLLEQDVLALRGVWMKR